MDVFPSLYLSRSEGAGWVKSYIIKRRFPNSEVAFFDVVEILHIVVSVNRYIAPIKKFRRIIYV